MDFTFEYRKLGDFTYHIISDPIEIKTYLLKWIMREWEFDHKKIDAGVQSLQTLAS